LSKPVYETNIVPSTNINTKNGTCIVNELIKVKIKRKLAIMSNPLNGGGFSVGVGTMQGYTSIQIFTGFETCDSL